MTIKSFIQKLTFLLYTILGIALFILILGVMSIRYVIIDGKKFDCTADSLTLLSDSDFRDNSDYSFLSQFKNLKVLDITDINLTSSGYENVSSNVGSDVKILYNIRLYNQSYSNHTEQLSISNDIIANCDGLTDKLESFDNLKTFEINESVNLNTLYEIVTAVKKNNPDVVCNLSTTYKKITIDSTTDEIILNNKKLKNTDDIKKIVELFPNVKKIEMCDCGISDEEMGLLREQYPDVTFVWMLHLLKYNVRTDAQVFSTLISKWVGQIDEKTFAPLFKYCTELRALDIGHCDFNDISDIANLKKLKVLMMPDNHVTDISALAELHDLVFLDMIANRAKDITPILSLKKLQVAGIAGNPWKDPNKLAKAEFPDMTLMWLCEMPLTKNTLNSLEKNTPDDCKIVSGKIDSLSWYYCKQTFELRCNIFPKWKSVKEFHTYKDLVWYDKKPYAEDDIEQLWKKIYKD